MGKCEKVLQKILSGAHDQGVRFVDLCNLLVALGFSERINGDHHIFVQTGVADILNLQPKGSQAKAYQVRQVRTVVTQYGLTLDTEDDAKEAADESK
jgi:hypothetical protein